MKVTQYITDSYGQLREFEISPMGSKMGVAELEINNQAKPDKIEGFGVAITGSSCYNLEKMESEERRAFLESIYSENGLNLSIGRLSVGASDYSAEIYTYDDTENDTELKNFSLARDEKYIIPMIKEIVKARPDIMLYSSPWSPPGWMKTSHSICGGDMRDEYISVYANYYTKYLQEYRKHGIDIHALTPQNELETTHGGKMPGCRWHPDTEAKFIIELRKKLDKVGVDTKIWILDHNFNYCSRVICQLSDHAELKKSLDGIAFHYYSGSVEMVDSVKNAHPDLKLHLTEGGPRLFDNYATDWCKWGLLYTKSINHGFCSFTGWNLLLDETGGPNVGPFFCGGLVTRNSMSGELSYSGQYKALAHFSKFIKNGAEVLPITINCENRNVQCMINFPKNTECERNSDICAVRNPDGTLILIGVNASKERHQRQVNIDGRWWYLNLEPDSISTFVFKK